MSGQIIRTLLVCVFLYFDFNGAATASEPRPTISIDSSSVTFNNLVAYRNPNVSGYDPPSPTISYTVSCGEAYPAWCKADVFAQIEAYALKYGGESLILSGTDLTSSLNDVVVVGNTETVDMFFSDSDAAAVASIFDDANCYTPIPESARQSPVEWCDGNGCYSQPSIRLDYEGILVFKVWANVYSYSDGQTRFVEGSSILSHGGCAY